MERRYYNAHTLKGELASFERRYGLTSDAFREAYEQHRVPSGISQFDAFTWATTYSEFLRLRGVITAGHSAG